MGPGERLCTTTVNLVPYFSGSVPMDLHWWLSEHSAWGTSGPIACTPMAEVGLMAVPTTLYAVSPHKRWQTTPHSALAVGQPLQRNTQWLLSQWKCSRPAYPTLQLRNRCGGFYSNNWGADPAPDRTVMAKEQRRRPAQHLVQALVTTTPITPPIKGIIASTHWGKTWQAPILKKPLHQKYQTHAGYSGTLP